MPTYQFRCKKCGHELEEFQQITEEPLVRCPSCNTDNLARVMGTGVGLIFKGSGFYRTDYKKEAPKLTSDKKKEEKKDTTKDTGDKGSSTDTKGSDEKK